MPYPFDKEIPFAAFNYLGVEYSGSYEVTVGGDEDGSDQIHSERICVRGEEAIEDDDLAYEVACAHWRQYSDEL